MRRHRLSVTDYHRMAKAEIIARDARVELIDGEIFEMTPIGSDHAGIVKRLIRLFSMAVGEQAIVSAQDPIVLGTDSEPEPDIALLAPRDDFYTDTHPGADEILLLVEVSNTSLHYDKNIKVPLYARYGIPEVWLIDIENREIWVFQAPSHDGYNRQSMPVDICSVVPLKLTDISIDLSKLF
ncbi:MAG: Uma2 family endonuclease [Granulosicoccus sp.]